MKARDLLRAVEEYSARKFKMPEEMLRAEAIRRGIWDELKGKKVL